MLGANWAIPDAEVNFKVMDTQWGNIVCGRSRSRIAGMSREGYPESKAWMLTARCQPKCPNGAECGGGNSRLDHKAR